MIYDNTYIYIYIYIGKLSRLNQHTLGDRVLQESSAHPAAMRCDTVLHQAFRARRVRKTGSGGEVRHGVTSAFRARHPKH